MGTLPKKALVGFFNDPDVLIAAGAQARHEGFKNLDAYSPYPMHGIDEVLGLDDERTIDIDLGGGRRFRSFLRRYRMIPNMALTALFTGAFLGFMLQFWTHGIDYPLNVGGRPEGFDAWPAYVVITFESGVLIAGLTTFFSLLALTRLFPNPFCKVLDRDLTDDRFALVIPIRDNDEKYNEAAGLLLQRMGADEIRKVD